MHAAPAIAFKNVSKSFAVRGSTTPLLAVTDITFSVAVGEVVSIIGPSGCGKSTLLNMGAGLDAPTTGEVWVGGERVQGANPKVAFMLQKDLLMPWRTIADNTAFGLELRGMARAEREAIAQGLLEKCRLTGFGGHYPYQLSGGMRQRAALARTLAVNPDVLLMDEPFSALDAQTKMVLQQDLAQTVAREGKTVVFITHDLNEAVALSDRIVVLSERPGRVIADIAVPIADRANPMQRRKNEATGPIVGQLMQLLKLDENTAVH